MIREQIEYFRPETLAEAVELVSRSPETTGLVAGGTDLMIDLRAGRFKGDRLVDLTGIPEMSVIEETENGLCLGAGVKIEDLRRQELIRAKAPALALAAERFAGLQVRNQATLGGNVAHAAPCGDTHPALILYTGQAEVVSAAGRELVPVEKLFAGPERSALKPGQILSRFFIRPEKAVFTDFQKIGRRKDLAISRVSLAVMIDLDKRGQISLCRLVLGACMPTTRRMPETEALLLGQKPGPDLFRRAAEHLPAEMIAVTGRRKSLVYKEPAIAGLLWRMLQPLAS